MKLSKRVSILAPSPTLAITAKANELKRQGVDVVGLGAGEPDFNTPAHIIEAAEKAMREGKTKYTATAGIPELLKAISEKFERDNGLTYSTKQIIVTNGGKHALYNLFMSILDPGDEVIIPIPYWVSYPEMVKVADGVPVFIEGAESNAFKVTAQQVKEAITPRTRALIINSPSNPTGSIYTRKELEEIVDVCLTHKVLMVSDEIYEKLIYDGHEHVSVATFSKEAYENTVIINGMSKPYSMTGWRMGYAAGNEAVIQAMVDLSSHSTSNPTSFAQYGALAALTGPQEPLEMMKREFVKRRDRVVELLNQIDGITCLKPEGAFYVFPNVSKAMAKMGYDDVDKWSEALLEKEKVALVPGSGFGSKENVRISYAASMEQLEKGIERIKRFVEGA
ncbi:pyridoxal phosphate-dependent aminotransferase [Brevibacillus sp. SYP-B805]|uniref:pyridoxal phosphate-dependent aminotransferase n=1 Tax=Brevibacillus sp. SYP-B805 TaxID=1578199 RepID=UPI0013EC3EC3|nr:pyridoxal phosphate-dependent aminotransferase [Brevibacillus sp. SYP-B805]NGQ94522.1 pyridoxal phosphate-dependent aminotransferase [Brevibacillus sp. SYP-B805]